MTIESAESVTDKSCVCSSAMGVVGHHETVVPEVLRSTLNHWSAILLRKGRESLLSEVVLVLLLGDEFGQS